MGFESFVTERLAAITETLNAYNTNAKTIAELPAQNTLDPSSLIHVSRGGVSEKLAIQKIIDSILSYQFNKLISVSGDITVAGNTVTVPAAAWVMDNVNYHTNTDTVFTVPFAELGYTRTDFIVADKFNTIYRVAGPETQGVSPAPNQPIDTVYITKIEVTDLSLANPEPPFIGEEFKLKSESNDLIVNYPDAVIEQILLPDNRNSISLTNIVTDIKSTQVATEFMYSGKSHFVKNNSGRVVTVWHNAGTGNVKYSFPNSQNYKLKPGEVIEFSLNVSNSSNVKNEYVGAIIATTDEVPEGSINKYSTLSTVMSYVLTGISFAVGTPIIATDTILAAFGKIQKQITDIIAGKQVVDTQIEVGANSNVLNTWHGQTILFTANCTITVPATLNTSLMFPFRTLTGVTVSWAITAPFTWEITPINTTEKTVGHFMRRGNTNTIILDQ